MSRRLWLWTDPFRYVLGILHHSLAETVATLQLDPAARILDYGCGNMPYRELFPAGCTYLGADLPDNPEADLFIDESGKVPIPDSSVDVVLSSKVLEHVPDPDAYLRECHRMLKPGGRLLLSTHGLMFFHAFPMDLWRWTADGLSLIVERAGLRVSSVEGVVGLVPTSIWLVMFNYEARLPKGLKHVFVFGCNLLMRMTDRLTSDASRLRNACVYSVVAERQAAS